MNNPIARKEKLVVQEMPDEVLVYDLNTHKAHCLNKTAAFVWAHCNGETSAAEIAKLMEKEWKASINEEVVLLALEKLSKATLLKPPVGVGKPKIALSRRKMMQQLGGGALLVPAVITIISPTRGMAATCVPDNGACLYSDNCCGGCCKDVGGNNLQCKPGGGNCNPNSPAPGSGS